MVWLLLDALAVVAFVCYVLRLLLDAFGCFGCFWLLWLLLARELNLESILPDAIEIATSSGLPHIFGVDAGIIF